MSDTLRQATPMQRVVLWLLHAVLFFVVVLYPIYLMASFQPDDVVHYAFLHQFGFALVLYWIAGQLFFTDRPAGGGGDSRRLLAVLGAGALIVGLFLPIVSYSFVGSVDYFRNGHQDGVIVLTLTAAAAALAATGRFRQVWVPAAGVLVTVLLTFTEVQATIAQNRTGTAAEIDGIPFTGLAEPVLQSVQWELGWLVLIGGAGLLLAAAMAEAPAAASAPWTDMPPPAADPEEPRSFAEAAPETAAEAAAPAVDDEPAADDEAAAPAPIADEAAGDGAAARGRHAGEAADTARSEQTEQGAPAVAAAAEAQDAPDARAAAAAAAPRKPRPRRTAAPKRAQTDPEPILARATRAAAADGSSDPEQPILTRATRTAAAGARAAGTTTPRRATRSARRAAASAAAPALPLPPTGNPPACPLTGEPLQPGRSFARTGSDARSARVVRQMISGEITEADLPSLVKAPEQFIRAAALLRAQDQEAQSDLLNKPSTIFGPAPAPGSGSPAAGGADPAPAGRKPAGGRTTGR